MRKGARGQATRQACRARGEISGHTQETSGSSDQTSFFMRRLSLRAHSFVSLHTCLAPKMERAIWFVESRGKGRDRKRRLRNGWVLPLVLRVF